MRKKPRKPRQVLTNNLARAIEGASKLEPVHRETISAMLDRAWTSLQAGENYAQTLADLSYASNVAGELCDLGICSDEASIAKVESSQDVLIDFASHHADWSSLAITDEQVEAMDEFLFIAKVQLGFVSVREFETARHRVNVAMESARRGVRAKNVTVIKLKETA